MRVKPSLLLAYRKLNCKVERVQYFVLSNRYANVCVLVIKHASRVFKKNRGPKTATSQNIGAASAALAAPLPTPMVSVTCISI